MFYLPLAFCVAFMIYRYKLSLSVVFIIGGIFGILIEQNGQILLSTNLILWIYVFLVYGAYIAFPSIIKYKKLKEFPRRENPIERSISYGVILLILTLQIFSRMAAGILFIFLGIYII